MRTIVKVKATYLFHNGMIMTFDQHGRQVPLLQGIDNTHLRIRIANHSGPGTAYHGFVGESVAWRAMADHVQDFHKSTFDF